MANALELSETPQAKRMVMLVGWRQWADAGSISSGLPKYLYQRHRARKIGTIAPDGFYLFQFPGTHDLLRPMIQFADGYPESLDQHRNDIYYVEIDGTGVVFVLGDEPHLDVERYTGAILDAAAQLQVEMIISFGGVYAEVPYNKERTVSCSFSNYTLKETLEKMSVNFSNYQGGASIGAVLCRRAADRNMDYVGFYSFVPNYDLSQFEPFENAIRIENDFMAWLGIMKRVKHFLNVNFDLIELEDKAQELITVLNDKIDELDITAPSAGVRDYFEDLEDDFTEDLFNPLSDAWENELRRLLDDSESDDAS